jgi:uncharacterized membrane protein YfcA
MLPNAVAGTRRSLRSGGIDRRVAGLAILGGLPAAVVGGLLSGVVDGPVLLVLSAVLLLVVGVRILLPDPAAMAERTRARRERPGVVVAVSAAVGLLTGLLANGGGFLLVPAFILVLGLSNRMAAATSLLVAAALSVPTVAVHWWLGHIDWHVALVFALGSVPGTALGQRVVDRVPGPAARRAFGLLLVTFALWFLLTR